MLKRIVTSICDLDQLVRLHQLGFVAVWPLLGLATVSDWSPLTVAGLTAVSLFFNTYGVLLDDAVHVDVDRRDPLRTNRWVVRGVVTQRQALGVALVQLPLMVGSHFAAGFRSESLPYLLGAVAGQGIYDIYGKKCRVPPLMEAAEAAAALLLVIYGATATGAADMNALVWLTAGAGAAFILLVNAFHGSLRDIEVELACNQRTTPIWLGCRGLKEGQVHISRAMSAYAGAWQFALLGLSLAVVIQHEFSSRSLFSVIGAGVAAFANIGLFFLLHRVRKPAWDVLMRLHVTILILPLMFAFIPRLGPARASILFLVYFTPTLLTAYYWVNHTSDRVRSFILFVRCKGDITQTEPHARIFRTPP
jgi:4-hydroxybenzoate polyprenyltransferase